MARRFDRLGWAMDQTDTTPLERFVLLILADMANEQGECWPSRATLMERTGYKVTAVKDALRSLQDMGKVVVRPRFAENGRQTSNMYVLCLEGRGRVATPPVDVDDDHEYPTERADDPSPVASRPHVEPPTRTNRKNNSSTTSKSRSSQRASARRGDEMADPVDSVFPKAQDDDSEGGKSGGGPDSAWGLNKHYRDSVRVAGNGFLGNTNDKAMRGFFAKAKREGVTADVLRAMVDEFVTDERLFTKADTARWRVFIANAESLRQRVAIAKSIGRLADFSEVPQFGGSIPQHILDEILAEAG